MNWLAHLHLSPDDPHWMLGSILPDLLRQPTESMPACAAPKARAMTGPSDDWSSEVKLAAGMALHHQVDRWSEAAPAFITARRHLAGTFGIFAPVLVDLLFDHCLAADWHRYDPRPLGRFVDHCHHQLSRALRDADEKTKSAIEPIMHANWLAAYADTEGMRLVLAGLERRLTNRRKSGRRRRRTIGLVGVMDQFAAEPDRWHAWFADMYPDIKRNVDLWLFEKAGISR